MKASEDDALMDYGPQAKKVRAQPVAWYMDERLSSVSVTQTHLFSTGMIRQMNLHLS